MEFSVLTVADFSKIAGKVISESAAEELLLYTGLLQIVLRGRINKSQSNQVHYKCENSLKLFVHFVNTLNSGVY